MTWRPAGRRQREAFCSDSHQKCPRGRQTVSAPNPSLACSLPCLLSKQDVVAFAFARTLSTWTFSSGCRTNWGPSNSPQLFSMFQLLIYLLFILEVGPSKVEVLAADIWFQSLCPSGFSICPLHDFLGPHLGCPPPSPPRPSRSRASPLFFLIYT